MSDYTCKAGLSEAWFNQYQPIRNGHGWKRSNLLTYPCLLCFACRKVHRDLVQCQVPCNVCSICICDFCGKNKNMSPLWIVTRKPYLAMCIQRVLMPLVKKAVCLTEGLSLWFAVSKIENNEENRHTYQQILHQWPSFRDFPIVRWMYFLSWLKMRPTLAVCSSCGLEAMACVGMREEWKWRGWKMHQIIGICHSLEVLIIVLANLCGRYWDGVLITIIMQVDHNLAWDMLIRVWVITWGLVFGSWLPMVPVVDAHSTPSSIKQQAWWMVQVIQCRLASAGAGMLEVPPEGSPEACEERAENRLGQKAHSISEASFKV